MNRALILFIAALLVPAQQSTIKFPFGPDGFDVVTFDESRVSANDVKHWMRFAEAGHYGSYGISLAWCAQSDTAKMDSEVEAARTVVKELSHETGYPSQLVGVVSYLRRALPFRVWVGEQYANFLRNGAAPESEYKDVDLEECRPIADQIRTATDREQACNILGYEWTNCVVRATSRRFGDYPKAQWKAFLDAYGIQEHLESPDND